VKVACLVPYPLDTAPSQRFRVEQWAAPLRTQGIDVDFVPFLDAETMTFLYKPGRVLAKATDVLRGAASRIHWALRRAREYDVVVVHREAWLLGVDWIERMLVRRVPTVFDFDDAVWLTNVSAANARFGFLKGFAKVDRILASVDAVSAGCAYLADHARALNPNVHIVPTSIDLARYAPAHVHEARDVLRVGWTGSVTTGAYLAALAPALALAARRTPMSLTVLGARVHIPGVDVTCIDWSPSIEVDVIRGFDVGLKPVPREDWVRGKCPMKDIQYMALGIPCVATRFGTSVESIEHGVNGFLCDTDADWGDAIAALIDAGVRRRTGAAAMEVVRTRYASTVAAARFAETLESARRTHRAQGSSRTSTPRHARA
jgi:glycosyltransferase involved in cell wall biosynthesis